MARTTTSIRKVSATDKSITGTLKRNHKTSLDKAITAYCRVSGSLKNMTDTDRQKIKDEMFCDYIHYNSLY